MKSFCRNLYFHHYQLVFFCTAQQAMSIQCHTVCTKRLHFPALNYLELELKKINLTLEYALHGYAATLIAVSEDDMDDSDRLSS